MAEERGRRKVRNGVVVSNKMDKTVTVEVVRTFQHTTFKRVVRRSKKYVVHDGENTLKQGDQVRIIETRPMSKRKRWRLLEVIERAV
ncbi:MAG: 30S ribosomal protein S17 [Nitrospinaceae bacterium]|jgi:small subunit ribosomal protein S17|nr:30S ribosomal protein S17 [Nitrospinaceae bacterium]MBT3432670.1 30S ribosomal protein S17 [Nitrospinaceae bacterium]MBT3820252.1 30S ribosomal protein S17 [Nitrospinaceae bacterium]MBT4095025.1 30S ribosomal protein S17 [Nitrospinaceae bacterium]MBT4429779.1 30S ribosomal protein S17 [Nitrospinaceae bacterium]